MEYIVILVAIIFHQIWIWKLVYARYPDKSWIYLPGSYSRSEELRHLLSKYIEIVEKINEIDYDNFNQTYYYELIFVFKGTYRPKKVIRALMNKFGLSNELKNLIQERDKIVNQYLLLEKLLFAEEIKKMNDRLISKDHFIFL